IPATTPMRSCFGGVCANAPSGSAATTEPAITLMNSRRFIVPRGLRQGILQTRIGRLEAALDVGFGSKADICSAKRHVRFTLDGVIGRSACGYPVGLVSSKAGTDLAYLSSHATSLGCPARHLPSCRRRQA